MIATSPITDRLLKLDSLDISQVSDYKVSEKKEVKNSGTNMRGDLRQTVIGSRVVITADLRVTSRAELTAIIAKLEQDTIDVTYFDPRDNTIRQAQFVADGYDSELLDKSRGYFKPSTITLTSVSVR